MPSAGGGAVVEMWAGVHLCCLRHFWKANLDKLLPALSLMPLKVPQAAELVAKTAKSTPSSFKACSNVFFLCCAVFSGAHSDVSFLHCAVSSGVALHATTHWALRPLVGTLSFSGVPSHTTTCRALWPLLGTQIASFIHRSCNNVGQHCAASSASSSCLRRLQRHLCAG